MPHDATGRGYSVHRIAEPPRSFARSGGQVDSGRGVEVQRVSLIVPAGPRCRRSWSSAGTALERAVSGIRGSGPRTFARGFPCPSTQPTAASRAEDSSVPPSGRWPSASAAATQRNQPGGQRSGWRRERRRPHRGGSERWGHRCYRGCTERGRYDRQRRFGRGRGEAKVHLAAACGTYCGACLSYMAKHGEDEAVTRPNPWGLRRLPQRRHARFPLPNLQHQALRGGDAERGSLHRLRGAALLSHHEPDRRRRLPAPSGVPAEPREDARAGRRGMGQRRGGALALSPVRLAHELVRHGVRPCGAPRSASLFPVTADTPRPY
jgi:hypothetical protein